MLLNYAGLYRCLKKSRTFAGTLFLTGLLGLIFSYDSFSGYHGFILTARHISSDFIRWPHVLACSAINFRQSSGQSTKRESFDTVWDSRFNYTEVQTFISGYQHSCTTDEASVAIDIKERPSDCSQCPSRGMASTINAVTNTFLLCRESQPPRRFRVVGDGWSYGDWHDYFRNFTDTAPPCAVVDAEPQAAPNVAVVSVTANGSVDFSRSPKHINMLLNLDRPLFNLYPAFAAYEKAHGPDVVLRKKSRLSLALLTPQPDILQLIEAIWTNLQATSGGFIAIHIRRGDKVLYEAATFPVVLYHRALKRHCLERPGQCPKTVFLLSDDADAMAEFRRAARACFHVTDFPTEARKLPAAIWNATAVRSLRRARDGRVDLADQVQRAMHAKEMIASMYLAALADSVICTYSSNVCRLVALLRGSGSLHGEVVSLDWPSWTTF
ncbi:hypothetical protein BV898_09598 [Hypsibius exemplaris]|uniref:Alpha-(1,6)-fucosyltransferase n=1 Tax=Hypsibius exemplaris TaxID=2072580 RepID=A0A1W0WM52_HYPEX|nr:hypothetical protein BV898_09598 [Hypsibius exemplaris]